MKSKSLRDGYPFVTQKDVDWLDSNNYWVALDEFSRGYDLNTQDEWEFMLELFIEWMEGTYSGLLDDSVLQEEE